MTLFKHGFGTCYFKEFNEKYIPDVLRSCEPHKNKCSKDCKFYVDRMNAHRCMKGFEAKLQASIMMANYSSVGATVFKAKAICAKSVQGDASLLQPLQILAAFMAFIALFVSLL